MFSRKENLKFFEVALAAVHCNCLVDCIMIVCADIGSLTLFRMEGQKAFPVTSTNVGISPQNILLFSFNPLAKLLYNLKAIPSPSPKFLNLSQEHP